MQIEDVTVGQLKELLSMFSSKTNIEQNSSANQYHNIQIVVADRGFVYVGEVSTDSEWVYITRASNIRVWGTSRGIGELVDGPLETTKLDKVGSLKLSRKALISLISVKAEAWKSVL